MSTQESSSCNGFTRAFLGAAFPTSGTGASLRRYDIRRDAKGKAREIAWGVALFVLAAVALLWLHVQFGAPIASVE